METLTWLAWVLLTVLGAVWAVIWLLIAGWVSTLLQLALLIPALAL